MQNRLRLLFILFVVCASGLKAQVTFIVESLPEATPQSDTIFITGTFNNWDASDPDYMLKKQLNGRLAISLPINADTIEYKFTRGSWMKVETNKSNTFMPNRIYTSAEGKTVYVKIRNWQDLGGAKPMHYIVFYFFAIAFQGIVLSFLTVRIKKKDPIRFKAFLVYTGILTAIFLSVVWYNLTNLIGQTHLSLLSQTMLFAWGPLAYTFYNIFRANRMPAMPAKLFRHYIPSILVFAFSVLREFNIEFLAVLANTSISVFTLDNFVILTVGVLFNSGYFIYLYARWRKCWTAKHDATEAFLTIYLKLNLLAFMGLIVNAIILFSGTQSWFWVGFNPFFLVLSSCVFFKAYFIWRHPEILRQKHNPMIMTFANNLKEKICDVMQVEKPYKDPDLNISTLSEMLDTKPHILSKVLNDHFNKNFRDFVNGYRIEEFIQLAKSGKLQHYTYLALAHEVGFNSKSTFNVAFKKVTNQSPRAYFKV